MAFVQIMFDGGCHSEEEENDPLGGASFLGDEQLSIHTNDTSNLDATAC